MKNIASFFCLITLSLSGFACTCFKLPIDTSFAYTPLIFEGKVVSQYKDAFYYDEAGYSLITNLEVIKDYRGVRDKKMITIIGGMGCDFFFEEGETYIVFASQRESGIYTASFCSETKMKSKFDSNELNTIEKLSKNYYDKFNLAYRIWADSKVRKFKPFDEERTLRLAYYSAKERAQVYKYALIVSGIWSVVVSYILFFRKRST